VADVPEAPAAEPRDASGDGVVWAAVRALPPKQRSAVVQRFLLDRPYAEIAETLECSEDAARQSVRAGLQRLRRELPEEVRA
jgi:RNA polymerase sigma factor (sigma-70 family)